jgi:hypothetical protein
MRVTKIHEPTNGGTLYSGVAVSARGRRYLWQAERGETIKSAFREHPDDALPDGRNFWRQITAPRALSIAVRKAVTQCAAPRRRAA